jgi:hypothetical protein
MNEKSSSIVHFIANLMPLYDGENCEGTWCARSLEDGTLLLPVPAGEDDDPDDAFVRMRWQGLAERERIVSGSQIATLAVVRYVQFHQTGQPPDRIAAELADLAQHFTYKTGCSLYLPYEQASPDLVSAVRKALGRMSESALVNVITKAAGL